MKIPKLTFTINLFVEYVEAAFIFLCFNYFFIPPFFTFAVGSLEGWLLLIIFLSAALAVIGRIQYGLTQARAREREAVLMYELSTALATARHPEVAARTLARHLQQLYQAELVRVILQSAGRAVVIEVPTTQSKTRQPDLIVPLLATRSLIGEVCVWRGQSPLPEAENRLIQNFANQTAHALERLELSEAVTPV